MAEPYSQLRSPGDAAGAGTQRHWLAAYTKARHETRVARQLTSKLVLHLLPTYQRSARWSDRVKRTMAPLFPGYVFVHVSEEERVRVLQTTGVVNIVSIGGKPLPLRQADVEMLQQCAARPHQFEPHPFLSVGQRVRVKQGPFEGWQGILVYKKNAARLVVSLEQIMQSVSVELDGMDVEPITAIRLAPSKETRRGLQCAAGFD